MHYDKLNVLREDKLEFEVMIKAKDLKNLNQQRKDELMIQRVHLENSENDAFVIQCDLDPNFSRHIQSYVTVNGSSQTNQKSSAEQETVYEHDISKGSD